jgi:hypothetical protein
MAAGRMPKIINPRAHAVIDYVVAGAFFVAAGLCWRRSKRAAIGSLICGGVTAINNAFTDYPGGIYKVMSFRTHGKLDAGLAALTATVPRLMGFGEDSEAKFFNMQSMAETAIIAMTDFDYYENSSSGQLRHHEDEEQIA